MYPTLDSFATDRAGEPLEILSRIPGQQAFQPRGLALSDAALDLLATSSRRGIQGGSVRNSPAGRELRDAGLLGRFGGLVGEGEVMGRVMAEQTSRVVLASSSETGRTEWACWSTATNAVVRAGDLSGGGQRVEILPSGHAIGRAVSWLGLSPAWPLADGPEPVELDDHVIDARLADSAVSAPAALDDRPVFARAWEQPWRFLEGAAVVAGTGFRVLDLGDSGYWSRRPAPTTGRSSLLPLSSATFFRILVEMFAAGR